MIHRDAGQSSSATPATVASGVVPQLCTSVAHRASFRNLVHEKKSELSEIFAEFSQPYRDDSYMRAQPTFFRRLLTCQPFTTAAVTAAAAVAARDNTKVGTDRTRRPRWQTCRSLCELYSRRSQWHVMESHNAQEIKSNQLFNLLRASTTISYRRAQCLPSTSTGG
jgi:hypothetical protein